MNRSINRSQSDHVNPELILHMQEAAKKIIAATDMIGSACRRIQSLDPHHTSVERFEVAGQEFVKACEQVARVTAEMQNIDERLTE